MPTPEDAEIRRRVVKAAKEHYQLLFDRNLAGMFRSALDGRMIECNEAFTRLLGHRSRAETLRHNAWEFCADPSERDRLLHRLGRERSVTNHKARWRRASGLEIILMMNASRIGERGKNVAEGVRRVRTAALRIRDIVSRMTRITRLEWPEGASPALPRMLDLRRSGAGDEDDRGRS